MREVAGQPKLVGGTLHLVEFSDQSRIAVNVVGAVNSEEKSMERIMAAAIKYSEAHPSGVLSSVVVNLFGEKIN